MISQAIEAEKLPVHPITLDVDDQASVTRAVGEVLGRAGRIADHGAHQGPDRVHDRDGQHVVVGEQLDHVVEWSVGAHRRDPDRISATGDQSPDGNHAERAPFAAALEDLRRVVPIGRGGSS